MVIEGGCVIEIPGKPATETYGGPMTDESDLRARAEKAEVALAELHRELIAFSTWFDSHMRAHKRCLELAAKAKV